jgi:hypothetical protein
MSHQHLVESPVVAAISRGGAPVGVARVGAFGRGVRQLLCSRSQASNVNQHQQLYLQQRAQHHSHIINHCIFTMLGYDVGDPRQAISVLAARSVLILRGSEQSEGRKHPYIYNSSNGTYMTLQSGIRIRHRSDNYLRERSS